MNPSTITLNIESRAGIAERTLTVAAVAGARFSSRDVQAMRRDMDEQLRRDGRLSGMTQTNPSIFRIGCYLLTQAAEFEVQGPLTGGEAEVAAILLDDGEVLITVGSDQCDRELDPLFPDKPKQMCPHPIAHTAWPYAEVREHWDQLHISSQVIVGEHAIALQGSSLSALVDLEYLLAMDAVRALPKPAVLYGGACPVLDSAAREAKALGLPESVAHGTGDAFVARLHDPVLNRTIEHRFIAIPVGDDLAERLDRTQASTHHGGSES